MPRPKKETFQRCFCFGNAPRAGHALPLQTDDAVTRNPEKEFFEKLSRPGLCCTGRGGSFFIFFDWPGSGDLRQSCRMASRALIFTARLAGATPDSRPMQVAKASAARISQGGMSEMVPESIPI